jgi:hypothetical protein
MIEEYNFHLFCLEHSTMNLILIIAIFQIFFRDAINAPLVQAPGIYIRNRFMMQKDPSMLRESWCRHSSDIR